MTRIQAVITLLIASSLRPIEGFSLGGITTDPTCCLRRNTLVKGLKGKACDNDFLEADEVSRRKILSSVIGTTLLSVFGSPAPAVADSDDGLPNPIHKVYFNVRIARQDGTFFVRDDLPDTPENKVFYGTLTMELFDAPPTPYFMKYVIGNDDPLSDTPLPSYSRSNFPRLDQGTGLLTGGNIPGLEVTGLSGGTALKYGERIIPAQLWLDRTKSQSTPKVSHDRKGLLTHRDLDILPLFEITTRPAKELDSTHTVFGRVVPNEDLAAFLRRCDEIPTYSMERPKEPSSESNPVIESVTAGVFKAQRDLFRGAAKSLGDSRLDKLYDGKLLRRVEVTKVGVL